jgi:mycofactocin system glycosyltransferase
VKVPLPAGFGVGLDPSTRRIDDGTVLVGGSPFRLLRLTPAGARLVDGLVGGEPVAPDEGAQRLVRRLLDAGMVNPRPLGGSVVASDVTAVVPVRDRAGGLSTTLGALGPVGSVVVVDDGSVDDGPSRAAAAVGATVLRHLVSRGPAAARNTGWRAVTTPIVAFVDADCEPELGWLDALLPHFDDPAVAAVAPRIGTRVDGRLPSWVAAYERARPVLDRGPVEALVRPRSRVPFVPTAALLVRRSALATVGGFDERLRFGEDVDLVWRLGGRGLTVRYEPSAMVIHPSRPTFGSWLRQRVDYGSSAAPLARCHGRAVAPVAVSPWSAVAWALAVLGHPDVGAGVALGSTALLAPRLQSIRHPVRESLRLAGMGHLYAGVALADAARRPWWPLVCLAGVVSRRVRVAAAAAAVVPPLLEWRQERPPIDALRWVALRLADDLAYGAGVWLGCARERSLAALRPDLSNWPGRRPAVGPEQS